jgi:neutral ceramidase
MHCGFGRADITPHSGITLSGFVARCNAPFEKVRDRLQVSALYIDEKETGVLIVAYDLLGIGPELLARLHEAIDRRWGTRIPRNQRVFCATHNHSGPATITLLGCGLADPAYWDFLVDRTMEAVSQAIETRVEARFSHDLVTVPGLNYNRRKVLNNGAVVMTQYPDKPVVHEGPAWNDFLFIRAETLAGEPIAGIVNWAAHACTVCSRDVTADFPGELVRRLELREGCPFLYLQGACGNVNLPFRDMTYAEMLADVDAISMKLPARQWKQTGPGLQVQSVTVPLTYKTGLSLDQLEEISKGMRRIKDTGQGQKAHIDMLANILNVPPDVPPDPVMLRYIAGTLNEWSEGLLVRSAKSNSQDYPLALSVVSIGVLTLIFVAAEVFTETALKILALLPSRVTGIVGYASPLVGYLPPDNALEEGGYEVDFAYRFYGHPAPFVAGSEARLIEAISSMNLSPS